jgi:hypothetical protein
MKTSLIQASFVVFTLLLIAPLQLSADTLAQPETAAQKANRERVEKKLASLVLDKINLTQVDTTLITDYLTKRSKELDPEHIGVKFTILSPAPLSHINREAVFSIENAPFSEVVQCMCSYANLKYRIEGNEVIFFPSQAASSN